MDVDDLHKNVFNPCKRIRSTGTETRVPVDLLPPMPGWLKAGPNELFPRREGECVELANTAGFGKKRIE